MKNAGLKMRLKIGRSAAFDATNRRDKPFCVESDGRDLQAGGRGSAKITKVTIVPEVSRRLFGIRRTPQSKHTLRCARLPAWPETLKEREDGDHKICTSIFPVAEKLRNSNTYLSRMTCRGQSLQLSKREFPIPGNLLLKNCCGTSGQTEYFC
jgi:hypothetical protein